MDAAEGRWDAAERRSDAAEGKWDTAEGRWDAAEGRCDVVKGTRCPGWAVTGKEEYTRSLVGELGMGRAYRAGGRPRLT